MASLQRAHKQYLPIPLHSPNEGVAHFTDAASPELLWAILRARIEVPKRASALFEDTQGDRDLLIKQLRNLVRQGWNYYVAASAVPGSSSALLYYYAALNLAKAELLRVDARAVMAREMGHGLSFRRPKAGGVVSGGLVVRKGVFSMLYEARTGLTIAPGTYLPFKGLIGGVPEVGWEILHIGAATPTVLPVVSTVVSDAASTWGELAIVPQNMLDELSDLRDLVEASYEEVDTSNFDWRQLFAISRRSYVGVSVWQERVPIRRDPDPAQFGAAIEAACTRMWTQLSPHISSSTDPGADGHLFATLDGAPGVILPPCLARYAAIYYLSSVVRYRPDLLDDRDSAEESWLCDRVSKETALPLLIDAVSGIERTTYVFRSAAAGART